MDRLWNLRARLQEWERKFTRQHGRRPDQVRAFAGWGWSLRPPPPTDVLLSQEDVEAAPEETRGKRNARLEQR